MAKLHHCHEEGDTEAGVGTFDLRFWDSTQGPDPEAAFAVNAENAGSYTIDIDVDNLQMTMTKNAETLFMMGNALTGAAGVWSLEWAQAFTPTATEHEFEWNGFLYAEDEEGLPTQFKFIKTPMTGPVTLQPRRTRRSPLDKATT